MTEDEIKALNKGAETDIIISGQLGYRLSANLQQDSHVPFLKHTLTWDHGIEKDTE